MSMCNFHISNYSIRLTTIGKTSDISTTKRAFSRGKLQIQASWEDSLPTNDLSSKPKSYKRGLNARAL